MQCRDGMIDAAAAEDLDSTLIRRGTLATTFSEMAAFAETLEERPLDKLLAELPGIALLSEMKFRLARQVITRRSRRLHDAERAQLRALAEEVAATTPMLIGARIRDLFA
jgi:hypothetical protein